MRSKPYVCRNCPVCGTIPPKDMQELRAKGLGDGGDDEPHAYWDDDCWDDWGGEQWTLYPMVAAFPPEEGWLIGVTV